MSSPPVNLVNVSTEISLTVAKYYGSSVFNPSIMRSDFRKGKTLRLSIVTIDILL